ADIAEGSRTGTEYVRILDLIDQLIQQRGIEPIPQADMDREGSWQMCWIEILRRARERVSGIAVGKGPVGARYGRARRDVAVQRFLGVRGQGNSCRRRAERSWQIRNGIAH